MPEIVYPQWRNGNEEINYPFSDRATLENSDGIGVDQDLFDDARLYPIGGDAGLYLTRINVTGTLVTFGIGDETNGELATGSYDVNSAPDQVRLVDAYGRAAGILVSSSDRLALLLSTYGPGDTVFEPAQTEFAPTVAIPMPQVGVRGLLLDDGEIISGDLYLAGADGIVLRLEDGFLRVDAIGDPYALVKSCEAEGLPLPEFCGLKTINGISPNSRGDFKLGVGGNLAADPVIRIEADETGQIRMQQVGTAKTGI